MLLDFIIKRPYYTKRDAFAKYLPDEIGDVIAPYIEWVNDKGGSGSIPSYFNHVKFGIDRDKALKVFGKPLYTYYETNACITIHKNKVAGFNLVFKLVFIKNTLVCVESELRNSEKTAQEKFRDLYSTKYGQTESFQTQDKLNTRYHVSLAPVISYFSNNPNHIRLMKSFLLETSYWKHQNNFSETLLSKVL